MALVKKCPDTWTENGVQSTFDIAFSSTSSLTGTTDVCGWGWRFAWDCSNGPVTVYFDPHLIANAKYGRVSCTLSTTGLVAEIDDMNTFSVKLPLPSAELPPHTAKWPIGRWSRVKILVRKSKSSKSERQYLTSPPAVLTITVTFTRAHGFAPPQPLTIRTRLPSSEEPLPTRIRACLADTIHGGELIDVKFWLYSRVATGYVYHPRPLYGNLKLLRATSKQFDQDLDDLLSGFAESGQTDIATDKPPQAAFEEYDYVSDSDMDDDEEIGGDMIVDEEGPKIPEPESVAGSSTQIMQSQAETDSQNVLGRRGYRIVIKGHAYNTWKALLYYLYTGDIHFRKIKAGNGHSPTAKRDDGAPECSPKSMYKLAEKHGLEDLKARALESIRSQMSVDTIVHEAFSNFTAMFDEVKAMQVGFLRKHLRDAAVRESLTGMLLHLCDGRGSSASAAVLQDVIYGVEDGFSSEY
ncbi:hypothetical protein MIND_00000900 [Mycena indigotica]|uniref:BTB domain-containing protein n=1 Tax=Mycena indigotica TaxID=2126181 RepID=A0A8H6TDQ7_9AGAR|nr:uncharacterized protein MIND_00000900 [Mycena indigotica]KAF7314872.1 hypothetical protein MIND_00000900 [Mycena indigotica]